jgi:molybdate transport system regulatory protein
VRLHIHVGEEHSLGPGKVSLLEAIGRTGSISAAARELGMAYRHAWELVDDLGASFRVPVVEKATGGSEGGGAALTAFGRELIVRFRAMERAASRAIAPELARLAPRVAESSGAKPRAARARPKAAPRKRSPR